MKITKEEHKSDYFTFYSKNMYNKLSTLEKIHEVIDGKKFNLA